jgi:excisionase family DNA binding protein
MLAVDKMIEDRVREIAARAVAEFVSDAVAPMYLSVQQAATYLGLSKSQLDVWRSQGTGGPPFYKHGHLVKYKRSELDSWMASKRRSG